MAAAFQSFDKDKDGRISAKEFSSVLEKISKGRISPEQSQALLKEIDLDDSGYLDYDEFASMFKKDRGQPFCGQPDSC
jgi:Ca2+-binding EF-hand superfamily protein